MLRYSDTSNGGEPVPSLGLKGQVEETVFPEPRLIWNQKRGHQA